MGVCVPGEYHVAVQHGRHDQHRPGELRWELCVREWQDGNLPREDNTRAVVICEGEIDALSERVLGLLHEQAAQYMARRKAGEQMSKSLTSDLGPIAEQIVFEMVGERAPLGSVPAAVHAIIQEQNPQLADILEQARAGPGSMYGRIGADIYAALFDAMGEVMTQLTTNAAEGEPGRLQEALRQYHGYGEAFGEDYRDLMRHISQRDRQHRYRVARNVLTREAHNLVMQGLGPADLAEESLFDSVLGLEPIIQRRMAERKAAGEPVRLHEVVTEVFTEHLQNLSAFQEIDREDVAEPAPDVMERAGRAIQRAQSRLTSHSTAPPSPSAFTPSTAGGEPWTEWGAGGPVHHKGWKEPTPYGVGPPVKQAQPEGGGRPFWKTAKGNWPGQLGEPTTPPQGPKREFWEGTVWGQEEEED